MLFFIVYLIKSICISNIHIELLQFKLLLNASLASNAEPSWTLLYLMWSIPYIQLVRPVKCRCIFVKLNPFCALRLRFSRAVQWVFIYSCYNLTRLTTSVLPPPYAVRCHRSQSSLQPYGLKMAGGHAANLGAGTLFAMPVPKNEKPWDIEL